MAPPKSLAQRIAHNSLFFLFITQLILAPATQAGWISDFSQNIKQRIQKSLEPGQSPDLEPAIQKGLQDLGYSPTEAEQILKETQDLNQLEQRAQFEKDREQALKDVIELYRLGKTKFQNQVDQIKNDLKDETHFKSLFSAAILKAQLYDKVASLGRVQVLTVDGEVVYQVTHKKTGLIYYFLESGKNGFKMDWEKRLGGVLQQEFAKQSPTTALNNLIAKTHVDAPWDFEGKVLGRDVYTIYVNGDIRDIHDVAADEIDFHPIEKAGSPQAKADWRQATFVKPNYSEAIAFVLCRVLVEGSITALASALSQYIDPENTKTFLEALKIWTENPDGATILTRTGQSAITTSLLTVIFGIWNQTYLNLMNRGSRLTQFFKSSSISLAVSVPLRIINKGINSFTWITIGELILNMVVKNSAKVAAASIPKMRGILGLNQHNIIIPLPNGKSHQTQIKYQVLEGTYLYWLIHAASIPHAIGIPGGLLLLLAITPLMDFSSLLHVKKLLKNHPTNERLLALEKSLQKDIQRRYTDTLPIRILKDLSLQIGVAINNPKNTWAILKDFVQHSGEHFESWKKNTWVKMEAQRQHRNHQKDFDSYRENFREYLIEEQRTRGQICQEALKQAS